MQIHDLLHPCHPLHQQPPVISLVQGRSMCQAAQLVTTDGMPGACSLPQRRLQRKHALFSGRGSVAGIVGWILRHRQALLIVYVSLIHVLIYYLLVTCRAKGAVLGSISVPAASALPLAMTETQAAMVHTGEEIDLFRTRLWLVIALQEESIRSSCKSCCWSCRFGCGRPLLAALRVVV